jgi:hypothetical protein
MKVPNHTRCIPEADLLLWRPRGVLNESVVDKILVFLAQQERKFGRPFNRFTDTTALEGVDLSFKYVFHVALYRRLSRLGREPVRSAFFVTDPEVARYVKLHALVTDYSPLKVAMFKERKAAAKWLKVDVELLECEL